MNNLNDRLISNSKEEIQNILTYHEEMKKITEFDEKFYVKDSF